MSISTQIIILLTATLPVGVVHTLIGPDHYLPFIALAKVRDWSFKKTALITAWCGVGHVLSAVAIGIVGIVCGITLSKIQFIEAWRGDIAAWALIGFGLTYFWWSLYLTFHHKVHQHNHRHNPANITPWALFIIFVLGPCEPVIPLIMYPALQGWYWDVFLIVLLFGVATIATMLTMVLTTVFGINLTKYSFLIKYGNALAGAIIFGSGVTIKCFGL